MTALAKTFYDEATNIEVEILSVSTTGLCKVKHEDRVFARHRDRLIPMNEEAKMLLATE